MDVLEAIRNRRSVGRVKPDPVPKDMIEKMLEAAVWAPNHYRTEPWRFIVLSGDGRRRLSEALENIAKAGMDDPDTDENRRIWQLAGQKAYRAPVIIVVAVEPAENPKVVETEERAAVHAGIQNMLLAAYALGLGAMWRTGEAAYHPIMRKQFGLSPRGHIAGFVYVGFPDMPAPQGSRTPFQEKTMWYDSYGDPE